MPNYAQATANHRGKRDVNGVRGRDAAVRRIILSKEQISTSPRTKRSRIYDPVGANRRLARTYSDTELLAWRAQECANYHLAEIEPYPENSRIEYSWRLEAIDGELTSRERRQLLSARTTAGFPDDFIADLKRRMPLHELIENGGDLLRKSGKNYRGSCPYHTSKSRKSLTVDVDKGLWHCHGCGKGGDHYTWICERWEVEFPDAVRILATITGVEIPKEPTLGRRPQRRAVRSA